MDDAAGLVALNSDPAVQEFLGEERPTEEEMTEWIQRVNTNWPQGTNRGFWAVEEGGEFIGWFHLRPARDTGETELGYRLNKDSWGRGLATEGSKALLKLAPGERVIARTLITNLRSRRVMEKLGMSLQRTFPNTKDGSPDIVEYAL